MKKIICYQTADGSIHTSKKAASAHAEDRFGLKLTSLAHRVVQQTKYLALLAFLVDHLPEFIELVALKKDCEIENPNEYED